MVIEMGAAGETGFVLMTWARLLAWAYTPDEWPFELVVGPVATYRAVTSAIGFHP